MVRGLKSLNWRGFLARPSLDPPAAESLDPLRHTSILVVGAGGSIGSSLALRLAALGPPLLVLLESSESNLYALQRECAGYGVAGGTVFVLGNVCDRVLLEEVFALYAPRLVFHAAAFKHVPLLEEQPLAAIENNIFGTLSLITAAVEARVILLSTDKAAAPISVMGATKRIAEHIVLGAGGTALRLGNVLASRGSVAEVFARQIATGGPLTVTGPAARRYFLTSDEAVDLLLSAAVEPVCPALLAPALPAPQRVADLARFMAEAMSPGRVIPIEFTGLRPGDKESEEFWSGAETTRPAKTANLIRIESPLLANGHLHSSHAGLRAAVDARDLPASMAELRKLVPDYTPSPTLLALAGECKPRVVA